MRLPRGVDVINKFKVVLQLFCKKSNDYLIESRCHKSAFKAHSDELHFPQKIEKVLIFGTAPVCRSCMGKMQLV